MSSFKRTLSYQTTLALVIGGIIGSGIFMKPSAMAAQLGSPLLLLSVWVVAGIITLFGALSNAEVACMFPETGGQYVFFQKMYGNGFAFLYGWSSFAVFNTAGNASIAFVCAQYADTFLNMPQLNTETINALQFHIPFIGTIFPLQNISVKLLTIVLVIGLTYINYRSVAYGGALQRMLTLLKTAAILFLIFGILFSGKGNFHNLFQNASFMPQGFELISAYMAAFAGAFWAYDGWNNITFVAGEIKNPQRNIPLSLFVGLSFCIIVYGLINLAFVYVLPIYEMASSKLVATDAAFIAWGKIAAMLIASMVILYTLGTTNANVLATARVTYAMGTQNRWFAWAGKEHKKFQTPGNALWLNAIWSVALIFSGSFDMLTDMLIFVSWFFYGMSALGVFLLRKKLKHVPRPYKVWGYPIVPLMFVAFVLFFLCATLYTDIVNYQQAKTPIINSLLGTLITCVGIPIYYFSKRKNHR